MAEIDVNAYATTSANAAAGAPTIVETQQPGGSGALRQVMTVGDPTTRANMQKVDASGNAMVGQLDTATSGTISATDALCPAPAGNGVLVSTAPTASSFVFAVVPGGTAQADIQITGTATGTYYFEGSMDSTTGSDGSWAALNYRQTGIVNTVLGYSATATNTVYRGAPSGFKYIRVRNVGGTTPSNPVIIRYSNGGGTTFLNASIPAGTNTIGAVKSTIVQAGITNLTALNQAQQLTMQGESGMAVQLAGTWTATVSFEASNDATNWTTINAQRAGDNTITQTVVNSTNNDLYRIGVSGFGYVRIRTSAYTSGTVVVTSVTSFASSTTLLSAPLPAGTNTIGGFKLIDSGGTNVASVNSLGAVVTQGYQPAPTTFAGVTTVSTLATTSVSNFNVATVTLRTFTGTTPSITFGLQASDDNTNWVTIQGINNNTGLVNTTWTQASALAAGTAGPSIDYTIGAYTNVRINITAISGTTPTAAFGLSLQTMPYESSPGIASLPALATGTNTIGKVSATTSTTGGATPFTLNSAATTNATSVKASAGTLYSLELFNNAAYDVFFKMYNLATAPTVGTSTINKRYKVPSGGGLVIQYGDIGQAFSVGIAYATTKLQTDSDATALVAGDLHVNGSFI